MKLPHAELAIVEQAKIADYLLNPSHPDNGGKAKFFTSLGFSGEHWLALAIALRELAVACDAVTQVESRHGLKYIVDGEIDSPRGKRPRVRTVWIVNRGEDIPRLVTAHPCP